MPCNHKGRLILLRVRACRTISKGFRHVLRYRLSKHVTTEPKHPLNQSTCSSKRVLVRAHLLCADSLFPTLLFVGLGICLFDHLEIFVSKSLWKLICLIIVRSPQNNVFVCDTKLCYMKKCVVMNECFTS